VPPVIAVTAVVFVAATTTATTAVATVTAGITIAIAATSAIAVTIAATTVAVAVAAATTIDATAVTIATALSLPLPLSTLLPPPLSPEPLSLLPLLLLLPLLPLSLLLLLPLLTLLPLPLLLPPPLPPQLPSPMLLPPLPPPPPPPPPLPCYYHPGCAPAPYFHGGPPSAHSMLSDHRGRQLPSGDISSFVYRGGPFPTHPGEFPLAPALIAPSHRLLGFLLHSSLAQEEHRLSSRLDLTRSFFGPGHGTPPPSTTPFPLSSLAPPSSSTTKVLKLNPIKDVKAYLNALGIIEFYLQEPELSTNHMDCNLVMTMSNLKASHPWEGQLHLAIRDGTLHFLFENKGDIYNSCSFEMLATLNAYCCPKSVANSFSSLLSIFNKLQCDDKPIVAFWSRFDGLIFEMVPCKVVISPLLLIMLLRTLHSGYHTPTSLSNTGFNTSLWK
jgi:hypothetical protein